MTTVLHGSDQMLSNTPPPSLSVCMIVRDEEEFLAQCLDSVKGVADEIIVVDTGSTDRTVEIAQRYTGKVYFHEWQNSFSEARNQSLAYASCEWILQIDADEELVQEDIPVLRGALTAAHQVPEIDAILVPILSDLPGRIASKHYFPRIHRRGRAHYEGIVHNQLVYGGRDMGAEIRFRHYGYNLSREEMERKARRSEALLEAQIEKDPNNTFAWKNLLRIYRNRGEYEKVVERGPWVIGHPRATAEQRHGVASDMVVALTKLGRYEEAESVGTRALEEVPDDLDIIFYLGLLHVASDELERAASRFKQFLSVKHRESRERPRVSFLTMDHYASEAAAWNNLGQCHHRLGRPQEAIEAYQHAIEQDPGQEGFYTNMVIDLLQMGEVAQAEGVLQRAVERGVAGALSWRMLGDVLYARHRLEESEAAFRRAIECDPAEVNAQVGLAGAVAGMGRYQEALAPLEEALRLDSECRTAWITWVQVHRRLANTGQIMAGLDRLLTLGGLGSQECLDMAIVALSLGAYDRAAAFLEMYLQEKPEDVGALADLATCYAKMGRYSAALEGYRAVLRRDPANARVHQNLKALERSLMGQAAPQDG